ncbi:MAG TPA: OmpA family protein, partial [Polyangium sp.]|nr:OmpA family protein [Polyangium sp.]
MGSIRRSLQVALCAGFITGCGGPLAEGPSPRLRLQHVVLYQNGLGYFERTGVMASDRLSLRFREREVDDVLKSVVVVEQGLGPNDTPSTVSAMLPRSGRGLNTEEPTELELVFSPRPKRPVSIAYAVPAAAWKATYRIILPTKEQKERQALLQAWALIDNIGDEDWKDVRVTLATGAPLSYASDLRSPMLMQRPELKGVYGLPTGAVGPVYAENTAMTDSEADGIADRIDACPNERGPGDPDPKQTGCPRLVRVSSSEIVILSQVQFERGSDVIRPTAKPILEQVAQTMVEVPVVTLLEIGGHASSDESLPFDLAMRRARAVQTMLTRLGVDQSRLTLKSYGTDKPIASNNTDEGRQKNRRVGFTVLQKDDRARQVAQSYNRPPPPTFTQ